MPPASSGDPLEVVTQLRSATINLGAEGSGFADPGGPLRAAHVRAARDELEQRGRASFFAERWATQAVTARARVIWRGWAQSFTASLAWQQGPAGDVSPRTRAQIDELTSLLSGPATRGELRVLGAYEDYMQVLFTLGWEIVVRADPGGDSRRLPASAGTPAIDELTQRAWGELVAAWIEPWNGRRRHQAILEALLAWVDKNTPRQLRQGESRS